MTPSRLPVQHVPAAVLRQRFNEGTYAARAAQGLLRPATVRRAHLQNPATHSEPWCTHSHLLRYLDTEGQWIAEVHQYERPDGTLGGSGRPDPKRLRLPTAILASAPSPDSP